MSDGDNHGSLSKTIIGGATGIEDELGANVESIADDLDVEVSESDEIFHDISKTLEPSNSYLSNIVTSGRDLYVPGFQRKYSWDESNHNEFWYSLTKLYSQVDGAELEDDKISLWDAGSDDRVEEFYFGTVYLAEAETSEGEEIFEVIDGQQRLSTVFIILNEIRKLLEECEEEINNSGDYSDDVADGVATLQMGIISQFLYTNPAYSGSGDQVRLHMTDHDHPFFQIILEDKEKNILKYANDLKDGSFPHWRKVHNILGELDIEVEEDDFNIDDIDDESEYDSLSELLEQSKQFTDSQSNLIDARNTFRELIPKHLDEELSLAEDAHKERALALLNLSIILITSFRIVECKFTAPVDETLKVDVFQSLNETGKSLEIHEKILARVVAAFGIESDEVENFETLAEEDFGGKEKNIKNYLSNYLLAIENEKVYKKGKIENNLLQIFNTQKSVRESSLTSRLKKDSDRSDFIIKLCSHADKYRAINGEEELDADFFDSNQAKKDCQNIINSLQGKQWKPFGLLMYIELSKGNIEDEFFKSMMQLIEKFMLRNSFASGAATSIDQTFIAACVKYNQEKVPEFDEIAAYEDEEWTDDVENFSDAPEKVMEVHMVDNSSWNKLSGGQLVRKLYDPDWPNIKSILTKLARVNASTGSERGRSGAVEGVKKLDFSELEREHILPQKPKIQDADSPYAWFRDFHKIEEGNPPREDIRSVYDELTSNPSHEDDTYDRLKRQSKPFIDDIGNSILLQNTLNKKVSNRQFSVKVLSYYLRSYNDLDDFNEYIANLDNLDVSIPEIIALIECFGGKLNDGETKLLLYELEQIFSTIGISDINDHYSGSLSSPSPIETSRVSDNYETADVLFEQFDIEKTDHEELFAEWEGHEVSDLVDSNGDGDATFGDMLDDTTESVLRKIASTNDETSEEHESQCGTFDEFDSIVSKFNKTWTWEEVVDRKVDLLMEVKDFVRLETLDDEFREYDDEKSHHQERVEEGMKY